MGWFSSITKKALTRLFGKPKTRRYDLRSFEKATYKLQKGQRKQREKAKGILTPAQLRKRRELTRGGKQELVLKLGRDGEPESYTLQELDKMAKAIEKKRGKYKIVLLLVMAAVEGNLSSQYLKEVFSAIAPEPEKYDPLRSFRAITVGWDRAKAKRIFDREDKILDKIHKISLAC